MNQQRASAIKVATMKIMGRHYVPTTKSTLFVVSKDKWDTKEGTGKSMKNALHVKWYGMCSGMECAVSQVNKIYTLL